MLGQTEREPIRLVDEVAAEASLSHRLQRVAVVTSDVPFVSGGHRVFAEQICAALIRAGHTAEVIRTPQNRFGRQGAAYLANWLTDVGLSGDGLPVDRVISLRYPAYAVRHPNHVCWLTHRMREYYDLWPRFRSQISARGALKEGVRRRLIHAADRYLLRRNVGKLYVISKTVQQRLLDWGGIVSEVMYPPPPERDYRTDGYEDFIFAVSRLHELKRIDLLVKAMKYVKSGTRAVIAGEGEEETNLKRLATDLGVASRIEFVGRVSEAELVDLYARCRGVFFAPFMEDYGFVTLEAFRSRKPVITCMDAGGPAELVGVGRSGYVLLPEPFQIAAQIDVWSDNEELARRMGDNGFEDTAPVRWSQAVEALVS